MSNVLIIHGMPGEEEYLSGDYPSPSNSHWLPWLQNQLLIKGVLTQTPEMPSPYFPNYADWKRALSKFYIDKQTTLIGHSGGAGFLIRWLSDTETKVKRLILVAPWLDPKKELGNNFYNFTISQNIPKQIEVVVIVSDNDDSSILDTVKIIQESWPTVQLIKLSGYGHFTYSDMGTEKFPELLEAATE